MDKFELLGWLLQNLRDDHEPDEADIGPALLRETTKIYELMIKHDHLTRDMFDLTEICDRGGEASIPEPYAQYRTTSYPITFVCFAGIFEDWLTGKDRRERLELMDLIAMIREFSWLDINIVPKSKGALVVVRTQKHSTDKLYEQVLASN